REAPARVIAKRRHLPVQYREHTRGGFPVKLHVPKPVVSMHECVALRLGSVLLEPGSEFGDERQLALGHFGCEAGEGSDLASQIAVGFTEVRKTGRREI